MEDSIADYGPGDLVVLGSNPPHRWRFGQVLAEKVESGFMTEQVALQIARRILYSNAMELYKLAGPSG